MLFTSPVFFSSRTKADWSQSRSLNFGPKNWTRLDFQALCAIGFIMCHSDYFTFRLGFYWCLSLLQGQELLLTILQSSICHLLVKMQAFTFNQLIWVSLLILN